MIKIAASGWKIITLAAVISAVSICAEWMIGFRLGDEQGRLIELLAIPAFAVSAWLLFAPLGRERRWLAGGATFVVLFGVLFWNAHFTTMLDERFGGAYGWSGVRVLVMAFFIGPVVALIAGVAVGLSAHFEILQWRKQPTTSDDQNSTRTFT